MKTQLYTTVLVATIALSGCAINGVPNVLIGDHDPVIADNTEKLVVGIPFVIGLEQSAVRISNEWIITAAHGSTILNIKYDTVIYHPTCDVALVKSSGNGGVDLGYLYQGETVYTSGYPAMMPLSINSGTYYGDATVPSHPQAPNCTYSITDATVVGGMSGGGVFTDRNELVGIISGIVWDVNFTNTKLPELNGSDVTIFVPLAGVESWITEHTNIKFTKE